MPRIIFACKIHSDRCHDLETRATKKEKPAGEKTRRLEMLQPRITVATRTPAAALPFSSA
jgi:hypothetical protein